jgi:anti-sigma factor RsiW
MDAEQLEFAISQYLDGTLPAEERAALEQRLASDAPARALLDEYRRLDTIIKAHGEPIPNVKWDALAEHISAAVDEIAAVPAARQWRIRPAVGWMAMAASLLLAVGIGWRVMHHDAVQPPEKVATGNLNPHQQQMQMAVVQVTGPQAEPAKGDSSIDVSIVRPPVSSTPAYGYDDGVVVQPSHVNLAGTAPVDDGARQPN